MKFIIMQFYPQSVFLPFKLATDIGVKFVQPFTKPCTTCTTL